MASFDPMAGSQIDVDPALKPKDADVAKKRAELIQKFLNAGATQEQAEAEADRLMANNPVIFGLQAPAQAPAPQAAAPAPPVAPPVSKKSHANLGRTWGGARDFESEEDRDNYQARRTLTPAEKAEMRARGMTEADMVQMQMSQQDVDMLDSGVYGAGQGWVPAYDPMTGRQTFKQRAPDPAYDGEPGRGEIPQRMGGSEAATGKRRIGARVDNRELSPDLQNPELDRAGYNIVQWDGPNGPEWVYHMNRPDDVGGVSPRRAEQLAQYDEVKERQQLQRIAGSAGVPIADARAAMEAGGMDAVRNMAAAQRTESQQDRMKRFQAQIQLGGGRLSPQAIQLETLLNGMDPEQRQRAMQYMAPGGALAAQVDARNLEAAAGLARNAVVGVLGQQGPGNPLVELQVQQQKREMNAALEDGLGESYAPAGTFGYNEFTIGEQQQMYDDLIAQGYSEEQARSAVDSQARKRRATQRLFGAGPAPRAQGAPQEPDVEPRPGVGTPGNKPRGGKGDGGKRKPADPPKDRPSSQTGRGASRNRNRPGDARPRN